MSTITKDKLIDFACKKYKMVLNSKNTKFSKLDEWLDKESDIFVEETKTHSKTFLKYKRGQIVKVDFGVNVGTEMSHTHFAIALNDDDTRMTDNLTVVPLTSKNGYKRINLESLISGDFSSTKYQNTTYAYITQIKTISKKRILYSNKRIICGDDVLEKIDKEIIKYLTKSSKERVKI